MIWLMWLMIVRVTNIVISQALMKTVLSHRIGN